MTRLLDVADASAEIATTGARSAKAKRLAEVLRAADLEDVPAIVAWLSGELLQRRIGVCALAPMLAQTASSVEEALADFDAPAAFEAKLDGARIQIHKRGSEVVEIALDGLQASSRYRGGVALRFARVVRYRDDTFQRSA